MSVKKAMEHIDYLLGARQKFIQGMLDPLQMWNRGDDVVTKMVKVMAEQLQKDIAWLLVIRKQLLPVQHLTKIRCRHHKKDRDTCGGHLYCMNCNADL